MFQFSLDFSLGYKIIRIEQPWLNQDNDRRVVAAIIKELGFHSLTTKKTMVPYHDRLKKNIEEFNDKHRI